VTDTVGVRLLEDGGQQVSAVAGALSAFLSTATRDVAVAIYDFHFDDVRGGQVVADTLKACRDRGVRVRIADHDEAVVARVLPVPAPPASPPEYVDSLGLDVLGVATPAALMHHKYAVIDGERVWTGSANWTDDSFTRQENCILTVTSPALAAAYLRDFEQLWSRRTVDGTGSFDSPWETLTYRGAPIRVRPFFCPGRGPEVAAEIARHVRIARRRIDICSPVLTSGPILGALGDVMTQGAVPVRGVVDATQMHEVLHQWHGQPQAASKAAAFREIAAAAAFAGKRSTPWAPGRLHDYLHAKIVICDDTVFAGSYNHSHSGEENAENVLALESAALADHLAIYVGEVANRYARPPEDAW
jgi:phosphatidylserine/phosphatidylglycerophosphate/cardiolipin synthase-like enzyme